MIKEFRPRRRLASLLLVSAALASLAIGVERAVAFRGGFGGFHGFSGFHSGSFGGSRFGDGGFFGSSPY